MRILFTQLALWLPIALQGVALVVSTCFSSITLLYQREADDYDRTAAFPLFGVQMYHTLGDQWATSLLAFLTVVMMPFPYIFFKYGKKLRGKSRFAST
jgi:hypothetical protein